MAKQDYFSTSEIRTDLKRKTLRGGASIALGQGAVAAVQLVSIPILSRLLTPGDFGVVAMAMVFTGFVRSMMDAGFASGTVQKEDLTPQQSSNMFWIASAIGVAMMMAMLALAFPIGWLYGREEVPAVVAVLSTPLLLTSMTIQHSALMRRSMRFGVLAAIRFAANAAGQATAIALAFAWGNYWAIACSQVVQAIVNVAATWGLSGWRPGWPVRGAGTRSLVEFGASLTAAKWVNYLSRVADKGLIGSFLGAELLGFYERATKLLLFPIQMVNGPVSSVMLPALSRLVEQPEKYRKAYFTAVCGIAAIGMPTVAYAAVDAERIVPFVLGPQWSESVPIFRALIPAAFIATLGPILTWVYVSQGRGVDQLRWQVIAGASLVVGIASGLPLGSVGVAWGYSTARLASYPIGVLLAYRSTPLKVGQLLATLAPLVGSSAIASLATVMAKRAAPDWFSSTDFLSIGGSAAIMAVVYVSAAMAMGVHRTLGWRAGPREQATA